MAQHVGFLSFRFGPTDGVSAVTRTWMDAFRTFGFDVTTISGEQGSQRVVPGIGIEPSTDISVGELVPQLEDALGDLDLVVVENLLTIPLNLTASRSAATVLRGRPAIIHHHDPPWHRERFAHLSELPVDDDAWAHVSINRILQAELAERGIESTLIYNAFYRPQIGTEALTALRVRTREKLRVGDDEILVAHPVRAIGRKNIPAAMATAAQLGATYWLLGPAEEGYESELAELVDSAKCRVIHQPLDDIDAIFAAADHIAFPSTWEGFGNPPIEAALRRVTVSVGHYPVSDELRSLGFAWFDPDDISGISRALTDAGAPEVRAMLDRNERLAQIHFSIEGMRTSLREVLHEAGWLP